ncbi:MAG: hypothetical protein AAFP82_11820 [Bacteroidota bacterium]
MKKQKKNNQFSRREFLTLNSKGLGGLALLGMLSATACRSEITAPTISSTNALDLFKQPMYPPKAKSVIFLYMDGGVSQVDSFG